MAIELTPDACAEVFLRVGDRYLQFDLCPLENVLCALGADDPHVDYTFWGETDDDGIVHDEAAKVLDPWARRFVRMADNKFDNRGSYRITGTEALEILDTATKGAN